MPVNKLTIATGTSVTSAGAQPGVAVGAITGDYTVKLHVPSFADPSGSVRIAIEESTSNAFSPAEQLAVFNVAGGFNNVEGISLSFRKYQGAGTDLPGEAGSYLRVNIQELNGFVPSLTYNAWIEY
jgi:hypothetical protein